MLYQIEISYCVLPEGVIFCQVHNMALASGAELWGEMTDANPHNLFLMKNWLEGDYTNVIAISVINIMKIRTVRPFEGMQLHLPLPVLTAP